MPVKRIYRDGKPVNQGGANAPFSGTIDVGNSLEAIKLKLGGTTFDPAHLTTVQVLAGTKNILVASGAFLKKKNAYNGHAPNDDYLDLMFLDPTGESEHDRQLGAFDTTLLGVNGTITVRGDIGAATAPVLSWDLVEGPAQVRKSGEELAVRREFSKLLRSPLNAAAGDNVQAVPFGPQGTRIKALYFEHTGNLTNVEIKENGVTIHKSVRLANEDEQKRWGKVPQANVYVVDFCLDGDFTKAWDTRGLSSVDVRTTFSALDSGYMYMDLIDALENN